MVHLLLVGDLLGEDSYTLCLSFFLRWFVVLLISTAKHSISILREVEDYIDGFELGIGLEEKNREICEAFGEKIFTIHNLPAIRTDYDKNFMMNPAVDPQGSARMVKKMVKRINSFLTDWKLYGVHGGLRGKISGPNDFVIKGRRLSIQKCIENVSEFSRILKRDGLLPLVALENIYGADLDSPAIGMNETELGEISKHIGLLLDLGHMAVNCAYQNIKLEQLSFDGLPIKEIHLSFLRPEIQDFSTNYLDKNLMYWDHYPYSNTAVNRQILELAKKLKKVTEIIAVEITGSKEEIKKSLELLQALR